MASITISITESPLQLLAGIPSTVTLNTNIPATIFYTLDGSDPTVASLVSVEPIELPTNSSKVILKIFATNGVDTSAIVTQTYSSSIVSARQSHDAVSIDSSSAGKATFPFGSPSSALNIPQFFGNTTGVIYDNGQDPRESDSFDGADGYADFYNPPQSQYQFLFSETNAIGERGRGLGTLPARVISVKPRNNNTQAQSSNAAGPLFDPRALVIFQDSRDEQFDPDIPKINRPFFDLEDQIKARDGSLLTTTDSISPQGGFLKAHYNSRENTLTYYYYDNRVARWIISKEPYHPSQNPTNNMSGIVTRSSRGQGVGFVFKWIPFKYRRLV